MTTGETIAKLLIKCEAIKLSPKKPFYWASGWQSPIYCDNRITLAYPAVREAITQALIASLQENQLQIDGIAGVATAGIPQASLIAAALQLPLCYVRASAKKHGMGNLIEGSLKSKSKVLVIEDLISTGKSSIAAVHALQDAGMEVIAVLATFSYGFDVTHKLFEKHAIPLITLSNYNDLINVAAHTNLIDEQTKEILNQWRVNPADWHV